MVHFNSRTLPTGCILTVGRLPTGCILTVGRLPTGCILTVGRLPTGCILTVGSLPTFNLSLEINLVSSYVRVSCYYIVTSLMGCILSVKSQ